MFYVRSDQPRREHFATVSKAKAQAMLPMFGEGAYITDQPSTIGEDVQADNLARDSNNYYKGGE